MDESAFHRQDRLLDLAQKDRIYLAWEHSYEECCEAFFRFANVQTEDVRNMLYGYADCGRLAQQRLVNLACEKMRFPDETN